MSYRTKQRSVCKIDCLENLGSVAVLVVENTYGKTERLLNEKNKVHQSNGNFITGE